MLLLPLAGFLFLVAFGRRVGDPVAGWIGTIAVGGAFVVACIVLAGLINLPADHRVVVHSYFTWFSSGGLSVPVGTLVDPLSMTMCMFVTGVSALIHLYSIGYMKDDRDYSKFFIYLNLFVFAMLLLVLADNLLLTFVGWEGVGVCSYWLVAFWFQRESAASAGKKAFIYNRIGDAGFLLAIFLIFEKTGTVQYESGPGGGIFGQLSHLGGGTATAAVLLLFLAATGKSAQIPLFNWLPDAMEGPTPVSALIHAATMVTAGVYMIARFHFLFDRAPIALATVAIVGAATAIFAATIGLAQNDIKRVLAYSTISQLGYMFLACGVAAYSAAIFHLMTHAFFKALLFLAAGSVIHAIGGEQDLRKMGGLRKKLPVTFAVTTVGVLAIAGIFPFAGFFSKDAILYAAFLQGTNGKLLWFVGILTALLTAFYMFRLWYMTFLGEPRSPQVHAHECPWSMRGPLVILAALSVCGGWIGMERFGDFLAPSVGARAISWHMQIPHSSFAISMEFLLSIVAVLVALEGWLIADKFYRRKPARPAQYAAAMPAGYKLLVNKYFVDEFYGAVVVKPLLAISKFFLEWVVDIGILGGAAWLLGGIATFAGAILQRWQSGNLRSYAAWLAAGAAAVLLFLLVPWATVLANLPAIHLGMAGH